MSVLNEIATALENYPADEVTLTAVDVNPPGAVIDVNETVPFQIRIANNGHVNMTGLSLHVNGRNGATVSLSSNGPFVSGITVSGLTVNGGASLDTNTIYFKAPPTTKPAGTELLEFHVAEWFGDWVHMFGNHTNHSDASSTYSNAVNAD